jgi:peptidyl-prolyl cis-trans isomerase SurA
MDAANPLCRWLLAAGLAATFGCASTGADRKPDASGGLAPGTKNYSSQQARELLVGRGQLPDPIAPLPPSQVPPSAAPAAGSPVSPAVGGAVVGRPVTGGAVTPPVQTIGYAGSQSDPKADPLKDSVPQIKVVALVGATGLVTDQEVIEAVRQRPDLAGLDGYALRAKEQELYAAMLRKVIERELILDDMYAKLKKNGKGALVDEIKEFASKGADQSLRMIRREIGLDTDEKFQMWLRAQGLTEPVIRRQIERQTMADEYIRSAIREKGRGPGLAEIRSYYDRNPGEFKTEDRVKWLDIFISVNKHASPQAARAHAEHVRSQAVPGKVQKDFVALVKEYDNGLAVGTNGVGVGSKRGEIQPPDVEKTVWSLAPGMVSELIETPTGYHIVKVVERDTAGVKPFDAKVQAEIREKILKQQREAEYKRVVEDLWRKGAVQVIQ